MKKATLNLANCKTILDLHQRIQDSLDFPDYYGKNLNAFWDCINRECDVDFVTIIGSKKVEKELESTVKTILDLFEENKKYWANSDCPFDYEVID